MNSNDFTAAARRRLLRRGRTLLRSGGRKGIGQDVLDGLSETERRELSEVHRALERIARGIFGRCEGCYGDIAPEHLEARPWQPCCAGCEDDSSRGAAETGEQSATL